MRCVEQVSFPAPLPLSPKPPGAARIAAAKIRNSEWNNCMTWTWSECKDEMIGGEVIFSLLVDDEASGIGH